jgi:hypothetical protein
MTGNVVLDTQKLCTDLFYDQIDPRKVNQARALNSSREIVHAINRRFSATFF